MSMILTDEKVSGSKVQVWVCDVCRAKFYGLQAPTECECCSERGRFQRAQQQAQKGRVNQ